MLPHPAGHMVESFIGHLVSRSSHRSFSLCKSSSISPFKHMNHRSVNPLLRDLSPYFLSSEWDATESGLSRPEMAKTPPRPQNAVGPRMAGQDCRMNRMGGGRPPLPPLKSPSRSSPSRPPEESSPPVPSSAPSPASATPTLCQRKRWALSDRHSGLPPFPFSPFHEVVLGTVGEACTTTEQP